VRIFLDPVFGGPDEGEGGIRRVIEGLHNNLPTEVKIVDDPSDAQVLHVHVYPQNAEAAVRRHPQVPLLVSNHGLYWSDSGTEWANWAVKANSRCMEALRQADMITAPSEWVAQSIRRHTLRNVSVVGHGIDWERFAVEAKHKPYVLWNKTRSDPVCDPEVVNSLATLAPDVPFISTYGDESLPNLAISGRLDYDTALIAVREAGVYLASARETFGIGTVEAMAAGVPILGWRWGGQAEFVEHGQTGYLARPGDYEDLLVGLRYCFEHRKRLGPNARAYAKKNFLWPEVVMRYVDLYRELLVRPDAPKVSVIVPAYNLAAYLPETLDSVAAQTLTDWECIIVDDASPDDTAKIARRYARRDKRFKLVRSKTNNYLAGSLNLGIGVAEGRYILPLDSDNMITPGALEILADSLDKDRSIHIAYGNVEFLEEDGRRWHSGWPPAFTPENQVQRRRSDGLPANLIPSTAMYRRMVWERTGGYRRRFRTAEDADYWTRATSYGFRARRVTEGDTLVYRNRAGSMSRANQLTDWTVWYPWASGKAPPPAGFPAETQPAIASYDPPQVTVVIPVGPGHEQLYIDALDSVDGQTFREWEVILVNDTERPLPWVPSWAIYLETAGVGVAEARNAGIARASARWFLPLDADDYLEPTALAVLYNTVKQEGKYAYCDWYQVRAGENPTVWETKPYDAMLLLREGCLHAVTALYPLAAWEAVGGFRVGPWEDWDFQLRLAEEGVCGIRVPQPLFVYRKDTGLRREAAYATFDSGKELMLSRFGQYFSGKAQLMGCGCKGKGQVMAQTIASHGNPLPGDSSSYALIEYTGAKEGAMLYSAPSGTTYRFCSLPTERVKYVLRHDLDYFLRFAEFRVVEAVPA
jgi:glycosyltransferase involved in cell wall biosynthesis